MTTSESLNVEESQIKALQSIILIQDRQIKSLQDGSNSDSTQNMWRQEAFKLSVQKRAIEVEAVAEVKRVMQRESAFRDTIGRSIAGAFFSELDGFFHRVSDSLLRLNQRVLSVENTVMRVKHNITLGKDTIKHKLTDCEVTIASLKQHLAHSESRLEDTSNRLLKLENEKSLWEAEKRKLSDEVVVARKRAEEAEIARFESKGVFEPIIQFSPPPPSQDVACLIKELHLLEAEAQRLVGRQRRSLAATPETQGSPTQAPV